MLDILHESPTCARVAIWAWVICWLSVSETAVSAPCWASVPDSMVIELAGEMEEDIPKDKKHTKGTLCCFHFSQHPKKRDVRNDSRFSINSHYIPINGTPRENLRTVPYLLWILVLEKSVKQTQKSSTLDSKIDVSTKKIFCGLKAKECSVLWMLKHSDIASNSCNET